MTSQKKGGNFEKTTKALFEKLLKDAKFLPLEVRVQKSGTQYGFDVYIKFLDEQELPRIINIECKDYSQTVPWQALLEKLHELDATPYSVDGFIAISPRTSIGNPEHITLANLEKKFKFPVTSWSPDTYVQELFALDEQIYKEVYGATNPPSVDSVEVLRRFKAEIQLLLKRKSHKKLIVIPASTRKPQEDETLRTNLDKKLDPVVLGDEAFRTECHQNRCDYKILLEELQDTDNELRAKILHWQDQLRVKARRLTKNFENDPNYSQTAFHRDFFRDAEQSLLLFLSNEECSGDVQKLLEGIVFELAAECPLDWRKKDAHN